MAASQGGQCGSGKIFALSASGGGFTNLYTLTKASFTGSANYCRIPMPAGLSPLGMPIQFRDPDVLLSAN